MNKMLLILTVILVFCVNNVYSIDLNFNEFDNFSMKKEFKGRRLTKDEELKIMGGSYDIPNYEEIIKEYFDNELKDPFSAQYKFDPPSRDIIQFNIYDKNDKTFYRTYAGYQVHVKVNAKNSFGAYEGWKDYYFLINSGSKYGKGAVKNIMIVSTFPMSDNHAFPFCILSNVNKFNGLFKDISYYRCDGIKNKGCGNIIDTDNDGRHESLCDSCKNLMKKKK